MKDGPNFTATAALIGDPARANMLAALMDGRALTATELSLEAGVTKQTASSHLTKLLSGRLIVCDVQGRHKYYRLADSDVAGMLETLMGVAARSYGARARISPSEPALRKARVCYDHLAGEKGVYMLDRMFTLAWIKKDDNASTFSLTQKGDAALKSLNINTDVLRGERRVMCRLCLDWSVRRHHLAGSVGAAVLSRMFELRWVKRISGSRVIKFSQTGEKQFKTFLR